MDRKEIEQIINESIIQELHKNNILEPYISIEQIRNKLINIIEDIILVDLSETSTRANWDTETRKISIDKKILLKANAGTKDEIQILHTVIHEMLHALTSVKDSNGKWVSGVVKNDNKKQQYGRGLTEGITEFLAQEICRTDKYIYNKGGIKFEISGSYPLEQIFIKQIAILYGESKIFEAYLNNRNIDIPDYKEFRENFDAINLLNRYIREKRNSPKKDDQIIVQSQEENIYDTFRFTQHFFLERCLGKEINEMDTIQKAEVLKEKLRKLNALNIKIEDNEKANYKMYNLIFVKKYLKLVNKNRDFDDYIKFIDVEKALKSNTELIPKEVKKETFWEKLKKFINNNVTKEKKIFNMVDRGEDGKVYIRECGKDVIRGNEVRYYQCFSEKEFKMYQKGNMSIKGDLLIGYIDFDRMKESKDYANCVRTVLLAQNRIKDKVRNYGGYIGSIDQNFKEQIIEKVQECLANDKLVVKYEKTTLEFIDNKVVEVPKRWIKRSKFLKRSEPTVEDYSR